MSLPAFVYPLTVVSNVFEIVFLAEAKIVLGSQADTRNTKQVQITSGANIDDKHEGTGKKWYAIVLI